MALYVTDTHPLLWYATGERRRMSKRANRIFDDAVRGQALVYIPAIALWEITILEKIGRIRFRKPFEHWSAKLLSEGFDLVPLDLPIIAESRYLTFSGDPFDVAIVATARVRDLPLITNDQRIAGAGVVEVAW